MSPALDALHTTPVTPPLPQFSWSPAPPSAPAPPPEVAPAPGPSAWLLLLYTIVPGLVLAVVAAAGCYVYHHRKHARCKVSLEHSSAGPPGSAPYPALETTPPRPPPPH
jgi:hypothetical protein